MIFIEAMDAYFKLIIRELIFISFTIQKYIRLEWIFSLSMTSSVSYYGPSMKLAYEFYELAKEEYASPDLLRQKDGCVKAYRAATETIDVLLAMKGESIPAGDAYAHDLRGEALQKWSLTDQRIDALQQQYDRYVNNLHGHCFYGSSNPKLYQKLFSSVKDFLQQIDTIIKEET